MSRISSLQNAETTLVDRPKILLVIGDGAEVMDTLFPFYRLGESFCVDVVAPEKRVYHLVIHELAEGWDITEERKGYHLEASHTFAEIDPDDYVGLVLPGGRAPEYPR